MNKVIVNPYCLSHHLDSFQQSYFANIDKQSSAGLTHTTSHLQWKGKERKQEAEVLFDVNQKLKIYTC